MVELLAKVYDQAGHRFQKSFTMLKLGWSDGYSFMPVGFNLLSSAKKSNRYQEISDKIDHRSNGHKARKESLLPKPDDADLLVKKALDAGLWTDYALMLRSRDEKSLVIYSFVGMFCWVQEFIP